MRRLGAIPALGVGIETQMDLSIYICMLEPIESYVSKSKINFISAGMVFRPWLMVLI